MPEAVKTTGREVMEELARLYESPAGTEQRRVQRKNWPAFVTVSWEEKSERKTADAAAHDISEGGLCLFAQQVPQEGTRVTVRFNDLPEQPSLGGTVRYSCSVGGLLHRIGVEFIG